MQWGVMYRLIFLLAFGVSVAPANGVIGQTVSERGEKNKNDGLIHSMGQPPKILPYGGVSLGTFGSDNDFAGYGSFGVYKDIINPALSAVGFSIEGYVGGRTEELDGGFRALIGSRVLRIGGGIDYNLREKNWNAIFYFSHPLRRGGLFGRGSELRIDWIPSRGNSFNFGFTVPLFQPYVGKTRPRKDHASLKRGKLPSVRLPDAEPTLSDAMGNIRSTAFAINRLTTPFLDQKAFTSKGAQEAYERRIKALGALLSEGRTVEKLVRDYHDHVEHAFSLAASGRALGEEVSTALGCEVASEAKRILLDDVIFPYNRLLGQRKKRIRRWPSPLGR